MKFVLKCLSLVISVIVFTSCEYSPEIKEDLEAKAKIGKVADKVLADSTTISFSLDSLTNYAWDYAMIITPYTPLTKVENDSKVDLTSLEQTHIERDDGTNVIAFIQNGKLVGYVNLPRNKGDFASRENTTRTYPYGQAEFIMTNKDGWPAIKTKKN